MKKKILNVGCGKQTYGTHFVDLYPTRPEVMKCNIDGERLPFSNNFFDEVFSGNIFEHVKNPGWCLGEMVRVLKKGGKLVLVTDNASYYMFHISRSHSVHYYKYRGWGSTDRHYALFTTVHLENFLKAFNMKPLEITFLTQYEPDRENPIIKHHELTYRWMLPNLILSKIPMIHHLTFPKILVVAEK